MGANQSQGKAHTAAGRETQEQLLQGCSTLMKLRACPQLDGCPVVPLKCLGI